MYLSSNLSNISVVFMRIFAPIKLGNQLFRMLQEKPQVQACNFSGPHCVLIIDLICV